MIRCSIKEVVEATGGKLLQGSGKEKVIGVTTDSRNCSNGQLFVPLVGEKFDGHDYTDVALKEGCVGCLTSKTEIKMKRGKCYIYVDDTLLALKKLATWYRDQLTMPFVQITGSTGKTTTKEMVASVLSQYYRTFKTEANYNNAIGVPQMVMRISKVDEAAVIETGMNHFGEIRYLGEIVKPDIAIITNIGDAHIENLGNTRRGILKAKSEIFENLKPNGVAVLNGDDSLLAKVKVPGRKILYGTNPTCDVVISNLQEFGVDGSRFQITTQKNSYSIKLNAPGGYLAYTAAVSVAVGEELGLTAEEIVKGISEYRHVGNRMNVIRMSYGRLIIDDCYNANPQAMEGALHTLSVTPVQRRVAILGDMGELGELSPKAHKNLGTCAKRNGIDTVIAIGKDAWYIQEGMKNVQYFKDIESAKGAILSEFYPGTACLVKASHAMHFEQIVELLQNESDEGSSAKSQTGEDISHRNRVENRDLTPRQLAALEIATEVREKKDKKREERMMEINKRQETAQQLAKERQAALEKEQAEKKAAEEKALAEKIAAEKKAEEERIKAEKRAAIEKERAEKQAAAEKAKAEKQLAKERAQQEKLEAQRKLEEEKAKEEKRIAEEKEREEKEKEQEELQRQKAEELIRKEKELRAQRAASLLKREEAKAAKQKEKEERREAKEEQREHKRELKEERMRRIARKSDEEVVFENAKPKDVLCLYYSRTGNTRRAMKEICEAVDGDIFSITDDRRRRGILGYLRCGMDAMRESTMPTRKLHLQQPIDKYKLVIIATPIWTGRCASPIRSFLKRRGLEIERVSYVLVRNGIRKYETVFTQMDTYTAQPHLFGVSLRPGDEGYDYWKDQFVREVKEFVGKKHAGKTSKN